MAIGWTKTQVIARGLNKQNVKERLKLAETKGNSTHKLQALMNGQTPPEVTRCVQLYFTADDYKRFEKAILDHSGSKAGRGLVDNRQP